MTNQAIQDIKYPQNTNYPRAQRMQDVLMVSSFGLWAALLGLMPGVALRLLLGS
jgi:hypothetical protein